MICLVIRWSGFGMWRGLSRDWKVFKGVGYGGGCGGRFFWMDFWMFMSYGYLYSLKSLQRFFYIRSLSVRVESQRQCIIQLNEGKS